MPKLAQAVFPSTSWYETDFVDRAQSDMPMLDFRSIAVTTVLLGASQYTCRTWVKSHGKSGLAKTLLRLNSNVYSLVCLFLVFAVWIPERYWPDILSQNLPDSGYLYHYSKFWEYADVILATLIGFPMDWHFGFHHPTTPYWTWARCILHPDGGTWRLFGGMNALHHVFMYANFAGHHSVRPILAYTGLSQLIVGTGMEVWRGWSKYSAGQGFEGWWAHALGGVLLGTYLSFFTRMVIRGK